MTSSKKFIVLALGSTLLLTACGDSSTTETTETTTVDSAAATQMPQQSAVTLADIGDSEEFPNAALSFGTVKATPQGDSVKVSFTFNVKNYQLKNQTGDSTSKVCNNSEKGQHIHFILDNKPYVALYEPKHEVVLPKNSEHHLLVFLSRSYHLSLKNKEAAALYTFKIDDKGNLQKLDNPTTPMVFYSRPKGDYLGKDTKNVLFDFYVWNGKLGADGYKVKADVNANGANTSFDITDWKPQFLQNLPMGKQSITLTLVDKDGKKVEGPETQVTREFNLAQDEPMNQ